MRRPISDRHDEISGLARLRLSCCLRSEHARACYRACPNSLRGWRCHRMASGARRALQRLAFPFAGGATPQPGQWATTRARPRIESELNLVHRMAECNRFAGRRAREKARYSPKAPDADHPAARPACNRRRPEGLKPAWTGAFRRAVVRKSRPCARATCRAEDCRWMRLSNTGPNTFRRLAGRRGGSGSTRIPSTTLALFSSISRGGPWAGAGSGALAGCVRAI